MFAFWVMVIDIGKGWLAAACCRSCDLPFVGIDPTDRPASGSRSRVPRPSWSGTFIRCGMDSAAAKVRRRCIGVLLGLKPVALVPVLAVWLLRRDAHRFRRARNHARSRSFPCVSSRLTGSSRRGALLDLWLRDGAVRLLYAPLEHRAHAHRHRESAREWLWLLNARPLIRLESPVCRSAKNRLSDAQVAHVHIRAAHARSLSPCWPTAHSIPASNSRNGCGFRAAASGSSCARCSAGRRCSNPCRGRVIGCRARSICWIKSAIAECAAAADARSTRSVRCAAHGRFHESLSSPTWRRRRRRDAHVCVAELQNAGRGRRGRSWLAPFGSGICMSLGWQFAEAPPTFSALSLAVGVAVVQALRRFGVEDVGLKWPNDLHLAESQARRHSDRNAR